MLICFNFYNFYFLKKLQNIKGDSHFLSNLANSETNRFYFSIVIVNIVVVVTVCLKMFALQSTSLKLTELHE